MLEERCKLLLQLFLHLRPRLFTFKNLRCPTNPFPRIDLRLNLPGEQAFASINGNVKNASEPDKLRLYLAVADLAVNIADIREILPDSLLPANLNLPDLRVRNARISGSLSDLTFDVPLETDSGTWQQAGRYNLR